MYKNKLFTVFILIIITFFSKVVIAKTHEIDMLNKLGKERMLYSKKIVSIKTNDEIIWHSADKGHNVEFIGFPKGASKYKSKINKKANYKFTIPGIYLYQCTPHKAMGMIGLVIVDDNKDNINDIKKVKVYGKSKKILKSLLKKL